MTNFMYDKNSCMLHSFEKILISSDLWMSKCSFWRLYTDNSFFVCVCAIFTSVTHLPHIKNIAKCTKLPVIATWTWTGAAAPVKYAFTSVAKLVHCHKQSLRELHWALSLNRYLVSFSSNDPAHVAVPECVFRC